MSNFSVEQVNQFLLTKQHLSDDSRIDDIVRIATDISGLHGTGIQEPYIALFARTKNFTTEQLDTELYERRTLVKIRCMRGTLYILPKPLVPIAFAATKPMFDRLSVRFMEFRGISQAQYDRVSHIIVKILRRREMTVAQIKKELGVGLNLSAVLNLMCDRGLLARVQSAKDWSARNYKYAVFSEYFPDIDLNTYSEVEAMGLLVKQYLSSFGPATEEDIVWWIGTTKANVRQALGKIAGEVAQIQIDNLKDAFFILLSDLTRIKNYKPVAKPTVNLLPDLDPYLMGYKRRERYLDYDRYDYIFDRSGNVTSTVLVDGWIVGVWDFARDGAQVMKLHLFTEMEDKILKLIVARAYDMGKFIYGKDVTVKIVPAMVSLRERTAGGYMSPLRENGNTRR